MVAWVHQENAQEVGCRKGGTNQRAHAELLAENPPHILDAQLIEGHTADHQGGALGTGVRCV